jgi:hypothetical protein
MILSLIAALKMLLSWTTVDETVRGAYVADNSPTHD